MALSPDGKTLASGSYDGTVRLWDVTTGRPIGSPLTGHTTDITSVAFSPDGKTLAGIGRFGTVRLWDVAVGRPIGDPFTSQDNSAQQSLAFSPDGRTLAIAGDTIWLWNVAYLADTVAHLCTSAGRSLTQAEWARWVKPGPAYQNICP